MPAAAVSSETAQKPYAAKRCATGKSMATLVMPCSKFSCQGCTGIAQAGKMDFLKSRPRDWNKWQSRIQIEAVIY